MWQTGGGLGLPGQIDGQEKFGGPHTETEKSLYDSHSDSGFLSGSNLVSSSSVDESSSSMPKRDFAREAPAASNASKNLSSSGCLDSGIDISDQLSSLMVSGAQEDPPDSSLDSELSPSHVAILREIFTMDKDGDTQLHIAVMRGFVEIVYHVTRLLPHQALLDYPNHSGKTPLHLAVSAGIPSIARHLIVCGASPVARDIRGNTPLHIACVSQPDMVTHLTRPVTHMEVMKARLTYSPSHTPGLVAADLPNYQGETCVHVAAKAGEKEILQHLTDYGADINAKERRSGRTALHLAIEAQDPELVAHIANVCRACVTLETYARLSPYQLAIANGAAEIATLLLDLGAPAQLLPAAFTAHDSEEDYDDDDEEEQETKYPNYNEMVLSSMNGLHEVNDIRLAGIPVVAPQLCPPVSTAPHTINADAFY